MLLEARFAMALVDGGVAGCIIISLSCLRRDGCLEGHIALRLGCGLCLLLLLLAPRDDRVTLSLLPSFELRVELSHSFLRVHQIRRGLPRSFLPG